MKKGIKTEALELFHVLSQPFHSRILFSLYKEKRVECLLILSLCYLDMVDWARLIYNVAIFDLNGFLLTRDDCCKYQDNQSISWKYCRTLSGKHGLSVPTVYDFIHMVHQTTYNGWVFHEVVIFSSFNYCKAS